MLAYYLLSTCILCHCILVLFASPLEADASGMIPPASFQENKCPAGTEIPAARQELCQLYPEVGQLCSCGATIWERHLRDKNNSTTAESNNNTNSPWVINGVPTIVLASRPGKLMKTLESLLAANGSEYSPVTVYSQSDNRTLALLRQLQVGVHITASPRLQLPVSTIALQYRAALQHALVSNPTQQLFIVLEDDIIVSPDFYQFLNVSASLLSRDDNLYCVSAHNDLSYSHTSYDPHAAIRTESIPNYGWMAERRFFEDIYMLLREYSPVEYYYDWDMLAYKYLRRGRECIVPEVSRSRHDAGGGVHISAQLSKTLFDDKNYNLDPNALVNNIEQLEEHSYELIINDMFRNAVVINPQQLNPCHPGFAETIRDKGKVFVLYFHLPWQENFLNSNTYNLLTNCLRVFSLYARESHHGLYRLRQGSSHLWMVGVPFSRYSVHRPKDVPLFYFSDQLVKELLSSRNGS